MSNNRIYEIIIIAMVAAIYAVLTIAILPLSYGVIQFRISEVLVLLCFYNKKYCLSMILGCAVVNMFSPMALLDIPFGTLATALAVICLYKSRNIWIGSLFPVLFNGVIVGAELYFAFKEPILISIGTVALGELAVVTAVGVPVFKLLERNKRFMRLIDSVK